jgi:tetratricopeptide (TPR) repeat protein
MTNPRRNRIFISYSHKERDWFERIRAVFAADHRNGRIDAWSDLELESGKDFRPQILEAIDTARVAVLLVSSGFLESPFILDEELPAIRKAEADGLTILWVPLTGKFYGPEAHPKANLLKDLHAIGNPSKPLAEQDEFSFGKTIRELCRQVDEHVGLNRQYRNLPFLSIGDFFKGREDELKRIEQTLGSHGAAAITQAGARAITGLGGIGKTRLAVEYAWRNATAFNALLFIRGDSPAELEANFARLVEPTALDLREYDTEAGNPQMQRMAVLRWMEQYPGWLLIIDNVDTVEAVKAVQGLLTQLKGGQVLITSRSPRHGKVATVALDVLSEDAAIAYLLQMTEGWRQTKPEDAEQALQLARSLDRLALALEMAAAYIKTMHDSFAGYLRLWEAQRGLLLDHHDPEESTYPVSVARAWLTSVERLKPSSLRMLRILSFLAPAPIPRTLFEAQGGPFAADSEEELPEAEQFQQTHQALRAMNELESFSLVGWKSESVGYTIHTLVQEVTRQAIPAEENKPLLTTALRWVDNGFVGDPQDVRNWPALRPLEPHALAVTQAADKAELSEPTARLMNEIALLLQAMNRLAEAEPLMRRALAIDEASYGKDHPNVAIRLNNLALLLHATNRLAGAEPMMRRALAIDEASYGKDHPNVAIRLNNLALLLKDTDRLDEAEPMMRRALAIDEASYGKDHPNVAIRLNNLAQLLHATNRLAEAEPMMRRALAIDEASYGKDHPLVAIRLNNLALLLQDTDRFAEAELLMRRAVEIRRKSLVPRHPWTRGSIESLAQILEGQDKHKEAAGVRQWLD